jgi:hypothetical protein
MSDEVILVCVPVTDYDALVALGSVKRTCASCGTAVWVAPSGVDLIAEKGAVVSCLSCVEKSLEPEDELAPLSQRQIAEAIATIHGHRRRN